MTDKELFQYIKPKKDYKEEGLNLDYKVEVKDEEKTIYLFFKETDSDVDWKLNFMFLPYKITLGLEKVYVPRGYALSYLSGYLYVFSDLISAWEKHKDYKIKIAAWSFGSTIAVMSMITICSILRIQIDELVTFGSVKCILNPFKAKQYRKYARSIRQYTNINDIVTWCVPFYHFVKQVKCGPRFNLIKLFQAEKSHSIYDEYFK